MAGPGRRAADPGLGHDGPVYDTVIVPYDGSLSGRVVLAPAADLAWRCGARLVLVSNTAASDAASRAAIKSRAMSMSGADVDFWVDIGLDLGDALVAAATHRPNSMICIPLPRRRGPFKRSVGLSTLAEQVFSQTTAPVLVVGPEADTSRGLPLIELFVSLDGSAHSEEALPVAVDWAKALKLRVVLVGVVSAGVDGEPAREEEYLRGHADMLRRLVPDVRYELVTAPDPVAGLVDLLGDHPDALVVMGAHGRSGDRGQLGRVTLGVIGRSPRAVLVLPARH